MRIRNLIGGAAIAVGLSVFGFAGPASAHDLNGGSAQKTCVPGDNVDVTWTFTSSNAAGHHIVSVAFSRAVTSSSFTADTVTAETNEVAGHTVSLTATATFEDQFVTSHTVTTTIPTDLCPSPTTVATTILPTTTTVPTTAPPTTIPPTTAVVTSPPSSPPPTAPVEATTVQGPATSIAQSAPTTVCTSAGQPIGPGAVVCALPTTGTSATVLILAGLSVLLIGAILFVSGRRGEAS